MRRTSNHSQQSLLREEVLGVSDAFLTLKNAKNTGILHTDLRFRKAESWCIDLEGLSI